MLLLFLVVKMGFKCYIWIYTLHLNIGTHFWFQSQLFTLSEKGGISKSEHFIWKYEISGFGLSCSPYLQIGGGGISESEHFIWKYELISGFGLSCSPYLKMGGISESEHFIWKYELISGFGLSCSPYLKLGGISDLSVHFIWQVDLIVHFIWKLDLVAMTILHGL